MPMHVAMSWDVRILTLASFPYGIEQSKKRARRTGARAASERDTLTNYHDGGEAILEAFRNLSVDYIICSPGSEWPPFWEAVARQKRDGRAGHMYLEIARETVAVAMANAYASITGRMQVVMLHAGAGLLQGSMAVG